MGYFQKFKYWKFSKTRLEAFSDAVFAIVVTLLVLELKVPHIEHPGDLQEVWHALRHVAPIFFSWVVSFFFVAIMWLHHHNIMMMSKHSDYGIIWINLLLLFFICLLPFPTAFMGEYPLTPISVSFWGITVSITSLLLVWFYYYSVRNFLLDSYNKEQAIKNVRLSLFAAPLFYFIAALLAWVSVYISFVLYALVPLMYLLPLDKPHKEQEIEH